ncbi:hypothetical protein GQ457_18G019750 [Hibiscus cannabinus]
MENASNLDVIVTFSKIWAGLCKKASEITTLLVFWFVQRLYSYSHPNVDRYPGRNAQETARLVRVHQLKMELTQMRSQLEETKKRREELKQITKEYWWEAPVEELDRSQLLQLISDMQEFKNKLHEKRLAILNANPNPAD